MFIKSHDQLLKEFCEAICGSSDPSSMDADVAEFVEKHKDADNIDLNDLGAWAEKKGYKVAYAPGPEYHLFRDVTDRYHIVARNAGKMGVCTQVEDASSAPETDPGARVALGASDDDGSLKQAWMRYRSEKPAECALSTRSMPAIVGSYLANALNMDLSIVIAFVSRLSLFGTPDFDREMDAASMGEIPDSVTPEYICYSPEEMDAIINVSRKMLDGVTGVNGVWELDMRKFSKLLREATENIPATLDIVLFGRNVHDSGLRNFPSAIITKTTLIRAAETH